LALPRCACIAIAFANMRLVASQDGLKLFRVSDRHRLSLRKEDKVNSNTRRPKRREADYESTLQSVIDWWGELDEAENYGAAPWEELMKLRHGVMDCLLDGSNASIREAWSLTAQAMLMTSGLFEC